LLFDNKKKVKLIMKADITLFEGKQLQHYKWDNQPVWIAQDVSARLGYSDKRHVANRIADSSKWGKDFIKWERENTGGDYRVLYGREIQTFLAENNGVEAVSASSGEEWRPAISKNTPNLTVLTYSGMLMVCLKTQQPLGVAMRRWLVTDVLPVIFSGGSYSLQNSSNSTDERLAIQKETLALRREAQANKVRLEEERLAERRAIRLDKKFYKTLEALRRLSPPTTELEIASRLVVSLREEDGFDLTTSLPPFTRYTELLMLHDIADIVHTHVETVREKYKAVGVIGDPAYHGYVIAAHYDANFGSRRSDCEAISLEGALKLPEYRKYKRAFLDRIAKRHG